MAMTSCPGRSVCESPNSTAVRSDAVMRMTATSVSRSWPMRSAGHSRPSGSVTSIVGGAVDDVAVGEDEAVGREHEARSAARLRARSLRRSRRADVDADDGRGDALDGVDDRPGIGVEQLVVWGLKSGCGESHGLTTIGRSGPRRRDSATAARECAGIWTARRRLFGRRLRRQELLVHPGALPVDLFRRRAQAAENCFSERQRDLTFAGIHNVRARLL